MILRAGAPGGAKRLDITPDGECRVEPVTAIVALDDRYSFLTTGHREQLGPEMMDRDAQPVVGNCRIYLWPECLDEHLAVNRFMGPGSQYLEDCPAFADMPAMERLLVEEHLK